MNMQVPTQLDCREAGLDSESARNVLALRREYALCPSNPLRDTGGAVDPRNGCGTPALSFAIFACYTGH
jgi:hypothetical protein